MDKIFLKSSGKQVAAVMGAAAVDAFFMEHAELNREDYDVVWSAESLAEQAALKKAECNALLDAITVEIDDGNGGKVTYQANKESRDLISQAVNATKTLGVNSKRWKLANNDWRETTLQELEMISAMGLVRHGEILEQYSA